MYKIVPAERQGRSKGTITKNRCKPSKNGLQRSFLAPPARLELTTFRLGGGPSILVRYGGIYRNYSILQGSGIRTIRFLGGVCYIHLTKEACRCIVAQVFHTVKRALPRQELGKGLKASPHNCVCGLRPIFCPIRAVIKGGNTYSIPALL